MMDGYQPNNVETKINVFEYGLNVLKTNDERFVNFTLKEVEHNLTFTNPPASGESSGYVIDPVLYQLNAIGVSE